jgi:coenzyme F420-reducing hydrogenase delta subunit
LLAEIGLEPERAEFLHCTSDDDLESIGERFEELVRGAVQRICRLGESPIRCADAVAQ